MTYVVWILLVVASVAGTVLLLWGLHRLCVRLEDRGYIYYRKRSQGGGGMMRAMLELDRLARPPIEHVIRAQDTATNKEEDRIGGK